MMGTTPESSGDPPGTTNIILDEYGDIIFELGGSGNPITHLRVSSQVMTLTSPVFKAMFTHGFAESQNLSSEAPRVVSLPEDNEAATILLCRIVYLKNTDVSKVIDLELLVQLTVLCHKYDCASALQPWALHWVTKLLPRTGEMGFERLLFITLELDLPEHFCQVTGLLVKERLPKIDTDIAIAGLSWVGKLLLETVEAARLHMRKNLLNQFEKIMTPFVSSQTIMRPCRQEAVAQYFTALGRSGLWSLSKRIYCFTIPQLLEKLKTFTITQNHACNCKPPTGCKGRWGGLINMFPNL